MLPAARLAFGITLAALLVAPSAALAAGGIPDSSFGGAGFASINASFPGARESGSAMVVDSQDRVLVGGGVLAKEPAEPNGGWVLARFRSDGTPDPTFGVDGLSREAPGLFGEGLAEYGQEIRSLAIEPGTGKIIAGGFTVTQPAHHSLFTIARYDTDGALDMSFGPANTGFVTDEITTSGADLKDIAVSPDGHITAVGASGLAAALARWDSDGNLDPDLDGPEGNGNGAFTDLIGTFDDLRDVALEPSGAVRAVGVTTTGGVTEWLVVRYSPTGARDMAFNGTGAVTIGSGNGSDLGAAQVLDGGVLYVFGSVDIEPGKDTERDFGVTALNATTGATIPGTTVRVPIPGNQNMYRAALQRPGGQGPTRDRFLLSGVGETPGGGGAVLAAMRPVTPGSPVLEPDPEFGGGGYVEPPRLRGNWADVTTDSHNRVVVGGELGLYETADLSAARYVDVPSPPTKDTTAPVISGAKFSPRAWAVKGRAKAETPVASKIRRGTRIRYTLSEAARVTVQIERRKRRKGKRKARFTRVGAFARSGSAGANSNPFSGKIGKKRLRPGRYRATLVATDAAGNASTPARVAFKVIRRR